MIANISSPNFGMGSHMYYDRGQHYSAPARLYESGFARLTEDNCQFLFDSMKAVARPTLERETQRIMDGLLREYLRRRTLIP